MHDPHLRLPWWRRAVWLPALLALITAACGPSISSEIGIRGEPVNVALGDRSVDPPPVLDVPTTGYGLIAAPVRLDLPPAPSRPTTSDDGDVVAPRPACPRSKTGAAEEAAPSAVAHGPAEGLYPYRRVGSVAFGEPGESLDAVAARPGEPLSGFVRRQVTNVQETPATDAAGPRVTFDVVQSEPGLRTTTSYLIDPVGAKVGDPLGVTTERRTSAGLKITRILLERADLPGDGPAGAGPGSARESFDPQPPVKIMNLPAGEEPNPDADGLVATGANRDDVRGVDPATGASMTVFQATKSRVNVDVCGRVIQGWQVKVSFEHPAGSLTSRFERPQVRDYTFTGEFVFAPQYALILSERFVFAGHDVDGRPYVMRTEATLSSVEPS